MSGAVRHLATAVSNEAGTKGKAIEHNEFEMNNLEGKRTREHIHSAFASRAMAAIKYDYFAQRAELECEVEAAATFRGLTESAKQQAMGYLELMEDYGDADFGATLDNLEVCAENERADADDKLPKYAEIAAEEQLDQVDQWFQDMSVAASKAIERLELTAAVIEPDAMSEEDGEDETEDNTKAQNK